METKEQTLTKHSPLEVVEHFMQLTNEKRDAAGAVSLMADDILFIGPSVRCNNRQEYEALLNQFLSQHSGWQKHQAFEKENEVCFIEDIFVSTPQGGTITLLLAEWLKVENGKIKEHRVFYDPTEFNKAFGIPQA